MPLKLAFVLHNHQPVGNLPWIFAGAHDQAYAPMIALLERHPGIRFVCHYTGPLLQWLADERPQLLETVAAMLRSGRAEVLGGGLYEPILAAIPDQDKAGQVEAMTAWLRQRWGATPAGAWLAERVWEPHLPAFLCRAGIDYTIVDEEHFAKAGLTGQALDGYWTTEDGGQVLRLFAASTDLRYLIPWRDVDEVMAYLHRQYEAGRRLLVFADDGEKFGSWPGTYAHVYENGWMERFFSAVEQSSAWLETTTLSAYVDTEPPAGRVYLPSATYHEMEEWSLPPDAQRALVEARRQVEAAGLPQAAAFMRVGHWRNFLTKYAEANVMQQRATAISAKVHSLPAGADRDGALDHVWQAQCNCPYWHGVFGGIYMYHVRHANFAHLIAAEAIADRIPAGETRAEAGDFDADGLAEIRLTGHGQSVFVDDADAAVYEWDLVAPRLNLLNTLAAYREAYAAPVEVAEARSPRPRHTFAEMLVLGTSSAEGWERESIVEWVPAGAGGWAAGAKSQGEIARADFWRILAQAGQSGGGVVLSKSIAIDSERNLAAHYSIDGVDQMPGNAYLAVEICLAPPPGSHTVGSLTCSGETRGLMEAWQRDDAVGFTLGSGTEPSLTVRGEWAAVANLVTHPLLSSHRTEHGDEHVYQGTRLVLLWPLAKLAGLPTGLDIRLTWEGGDCPV